jgi:hypothetical protein
VLVAKKPDSLPQYSQNIGTNVDDKDEEVGGDGDAYLPHLHSGATHPKFLPKLSIHEHYVNRLQQLKPHLGSSRVFLPPPTEILSIRTLMKTLLSALNVLQKKWCLAQLHHEVCPQASAVPPMIVTW